MFMLHAVGCEYLYSMHGDDQAPLHCNTEKDKGRFRHRTAGKHETCNLTENIPNSISINQYSVQLAYLAIYYISKLSLMHIWLDTSTVVLIKVNPLCHAVSFILHFPYLFGKSDKASRCVNSVPSYRPIPATRFYPIQQHNISKVQG